MNMLSTLGTSIFCLWFLTTQANATVTYVASQQQFNDAHNAAGMNDTIIWRSGTYSDIFMSIRKDHLYITADTLGGTIFTGLSRVDIAVTGDYVTLRGFQFLDGNIGTRDVINTRGSYNTFTQINIRAYRSYKYLRVREESQYVNITYCNFENRLNLDDQNILSILVDANQPGYHKIQYCSFKNFDGTGNDLGIEPIRIGVSTQADRNSRSLVEYCYFTQCNGDGEIISSKASQNVYRYNTFEDNPKAELVLRHGSEAIVYGNFFLRGKGGIRVREGQDHYIYNNYFYELADRSIYLQNEDSDPLDNINIAFNTIIDCAETRLGGSGSDRPTNVTFANNIFSDPDDRLFQDPTGTETWIENISFGSLGITTPATGMTMIDPQLTANTSGYFGLAQGSPAIDAAQSGYAPLPNFSGIDSIDISMVFDLMKQSRPTVITDKDLGCNEYPHNVMIQPIATADNTGPSYNTSNTTGLSDPTLFVTDLIKIHQNPISSQLTISASSKQHTELCLDIFNSEGKKAKSIAKDTRFSGNITLSENVEYLPAGFYTIRATSQSGQGALRIQTLKFIKSK